MAGPKRKTMITIIATALMMMGYGLAEKAAAQEESSSRSTVSMAVEIQISTHVGRIQEVTGRVRAKGEPVLLVRADLPNEPWWVQGKPTPTAKDRFKAKAIFGNSRSPAGARFRVLVILVDPKVALRDYPTGQVIRKLRDVPRSREMLVTMPRTGRPVIRAVPLKKVVSDSKSDETETEAFPVKFTSPKTGSTVRQTTTLSGKVEAGFTPVLLVRPLTKDSVWWIQKPIRVGQTGEFSAKVVIGSQRTAEGTRFRIVALAVPDDSKAKEEPKDKSESNVPFIPGDFLRKLSDDIATSKELVLTLRRSATASTDAKTSGTSRK